MASIRGRSIAWGWVLAALLTGCGSHIYHVVRRGDTLYTIGWHHEQDYRDIAQWNDIPAPYILKPGQRLRVAPPTPIQSARGARNTEGARPPVVSASQRVIAKLDNTIEPKTDKKISPRVEAKNSVAEASSGNDGPDAVPWRWPTNSNAVRVFSGLSPTNKGIDIYGAVGQPVYAAATGRIVYSGSGLIGYGKLIIVKHNDTFLSAYAHNDEILVKEGDEVTAGQQIARMGRTGTDRVMLHFEIRQNGKPINPMEQLPRRHLQQVEDSG